MSITRYPFFAQRIQTGLSRKIEVQVAMGSTYSIQAKFKYLYIFAVERIYNYVQHTASSNPLEIETEERAARTNVVGTLPRSSEDNGSR